MFRVVAIGALAGTFCFVGPAVGDSRAQGVWVGGGGVRVRAPFVRVDVGPYGGVSVRAPFAAVDLPPRGYYEDEDYYPSPRVLDRRVVEPAYPTAADFAVMGTDELHQAIRSISHDLHRRLDRFDTGESWQRYLQLSDDAVSPSVSPEERLAALATMLERFQRVAAEPQYSMISRLPAFQAMEAALNEAFVRSDSANSPGDATVEDLPLPAPERPARNERDRPFFTPRPSP